MKITKKQAKSLGNKFSINFDIIEFNEWHYGLNVELEHGRQLGLTNVSNNSLVLTAKIALAHLMEYPDYYKRLKIMEDKADIYWHNKQINIFLEKKQ